MKIVDRDQLLSLTEDLADLIKNFHPGRDGEWDAFEKSVAAHRQLRKIDFDALTQLNLPLEEQ